MSKRLAYIQMDISFLLLDTGHDAHHILLRSLDIFLCPGNEEFPCLQDVTRLIFIRDTERNNVEFLEIRSEILRAAHIEHLQQSLLGSVDAVLGTAFTLCDPDGALSGSNRVADVLRKHLR